MRTEFAKLHRAMLVIVRESEVCRRLMTVPGVGALIAVTFTAAVDCRSDLQNREQWHAFRPHPEKISIGRNGHHGCCQPGGRFHGSHRLVRGRTYYAHASGPVLHAQAWAMDVAKRRGMKRAKVALARKLGVILHRMWVDGTTFRWGREAVAA